MTGIDWRRVDRAAQATMNPVDVETALDRGVRTGEEIFRRRLVRRQLLAAGVVAVVTAGAFVVRGVVHETPPAPSGVPAVTSVDPSGGPAAGGTAVTITGTGLDGATAVGFGPNGATDVVVESATRITATSPPGGGTVDVTVTTPDGSSPTGIAQARFQYGADPAGPVVLSVSPATGPTDGGTVVTIAGTRFTDATGVTFGANDAATFTVDSSTRITATSPAGSGTVDVGVVAPSGTSTADGDDARFTYETPAQPPVVRSVDPASGPAAGGSTVTITGTGFTGATAVAFGTSDATAVSVDSATRITATSPPGTGTVDVTVTTPAGTSPAGPNQARFTYAAAPAGPVVRSLDPTVGCDVGKTTVVISGTGFTGATAVRFGPTAAAGFTVSSATRITATSPPGTGTVDVTVTTPAGTSPSGPTPARFTYEFCEP